MGVQIRMELSKKCIVPRRLDEASLCLDEFDVGKLNALMIR